MSTAVHGNPRIDEKYQRVINDLREIDREILTNLSEEILEDLAAAIKEANANVLPLIPKYLMTRLMQSATARGAIERYKELLEMIK